EQHSYLNSIYPNSVNTLRAITVRNNNGTVDFIAATLRMGVGGNQVDNSSAGGLLIGIDLNTGMSLKPYATYEYGIEKFDKHPDTGFNFFELRIPNWENNKKEIINAAKKLTQLNLVGWDIAITQKGIIIIEANTLFGLDHTQAGIGGMKDFFVKNDPKNLKNIYDFKG
ncbi:MAG: sugar-transfer associated ATP-grasp domain-containing protein, partial [Pseudoalteromonas tetraodonis]|nr:sugar-transfer associated ATP-grasp domain-containing protein [Pseudoalteromonas tetraodonis]